MFHRIKRALAPSLSCQTRADYLHIFSWIYTLTKCCMIKCCMCYLLWLGTPLVSYNETLETKERSLLILHVV